MGLGSKFLRSDLNRWYLTHFPNYSRPIGLSPLWPKNKAQGSRFQEWACSMKAIRGLLPHKNLSFSSMGLAHRICVAVRGTWGEGSRELHIMWCEALYIHMCAGPWHLRCCSPIIGPKVFTVDPHQTITKCRSLYLSRVMTPSLIDSCTLSDTFLMCCFFMCWFSLKCLNYPPTFFNYTYFL